MRTAHHEWQVEAGGVLRHPNGLCAIAPDARGGEADWTLLLPADWELEDLDAEAWRASAAAAYGRFLAARH
jgi:hypothetical protein